MEHAILSRRTEEEDMADYSNVAPPSSNAGGGMNDAFKDALQRARQVGMLNKLHGVLNYFAVSQTVVLKGFFCLVAKGVVLS